MTTQPTAPPSTQEEFLRVGGGTSASDLAGAIAAAVLEGNAGQPVKLRAVGAAAVNQAVKAIAIARGITAPRGVDLTVRPGFQNIESRDGRITAITLQIVTG